MILPFSSSSLTRRLLFLLGLKALCMMVVIFYAGIELGPDEAQYWTWSQSLDWGYYSKPPGIAWQIWLGTQLFGQTEWGVRSITVLLAIFQALAVYQLALRSGLLSRTAFWCSVLMAFCPLGVIGSFLAITDIGFLFCWTGACLTVVAALNEKQSPNPISIGIWLLAGALFKWPIYLFWLFFLFCRHWYFPTQKKRDLFLGIFISLLGLLPSIWWNWSHDWATFRHVSATIQGGSGSHPGGNVGEFLGAQALLLSPILFILLLYSGSQWIRQRNQLSPALFFCGFVTFATLGVGSLISSFQKIQGNWMVFAYPTAFIILGWDVFQQHPKRALWAKIGLGFSLTLTFFIFLFPSFYTKPSLAFFTPPYHLNPFKHNLGSIALSENLIKQGYQPSKHFLFSDKYQTTSLLSFYGKEKKRAYFFNLQGMRKNQFSYWPSLQEEQQGKIGYFVWTENIPYLEREGKTKFKFYQEELRKYFEKVEFLEQIPLVYENSRIVKAAFLFRCENCKELQPKTSQLY